MMEPSDSACDKQVVLCSGFSRAIVELRAHVWAWSSSVRLLGLSRRCDRIQGPRFGEPYTPPTIAPHTSHEDPRWRDRMRTDESRLTFRRQQKQPQFAQPILRNTRKGKTVAAVRTESDDEKRWMEVKADRGKKEGRAQVSWTMRKLFPCLPLSSGFDGAAV